MNYQEALDYLYSLVDYSLTRSFRYSPEKFDLGRMRAFLKLLGNPEKDFPCIHVAGTKGKGSVSALMASSLKAAGYKTGLYTSPHLSDYCERIQINNQPLDHKMFASLIEEIRPLVSQLENLSTFEVTTALAFLYFSRQKINAAVIEVGLGGRLDATNVVDPVTAVITSISYDHMAVLGNTLEQIAAEKGGIIKAERPVVVAPQNDAVTVVLKNIALERHAPFFQTGVDFHYEMRDHSLDGQSFYAWNSEQQSDGKMTYSIPLLGRHQVENAVTALAALHVANRNGLPVSDQAIQKGFSDVLWPGRFEIINREPLVIVDSAHNRDSARRLRETLDDYFPDTPVLLVFGASEDKDVKGMFDELAPRINHVIATKSFHPRAMEPETIADIASGHSITVDQTESIETACQLAAKIVENNGLILAAGSLFVAAAVRETWQNIILPLHTH